MLILSLDSVFIAINNTKKKQNKKKNKENRSKINITPFQEFFIMECTSWNNGKMKGRCIWSVKAKMVR